MSEFKENILATKSFNFAVNALIIFDKLKEIRHYELANQFIRSAASIGSNVEESIGAQSDRDFLSKLSISYKEARETSYWLRLFVAGKLISLQDANQQLEDCNELIRILGASTRTMRIKIESQIIKK